MPPPPPKIWVNLKNMMMSKSSQTQKNVFCVELSHEVREQEKLIYGDKSQNGGSLEQGAGSITDYRHELISRMYTCASFPQPVHLRFMYFIVCKLCFHFLIKVILRPLGHVYPFILWIIHRQGPRWKDVLAWHILEHMPLYQMPEKFIYHDHSLYKSFSYMNP